ncbi:MULTISPECIES: OadG family protein [Amphritea]|uniref:Probable oxaloacetate decarboxylase gamma chain n=2 Tax=Amphritea TaxID=515417 RepID=A0A1H9K7G6_9GAMM|nr:MULTISPECIES: OadG family protein [Amphritea]MBN0986977.1 OadG family protein [Amphritea pacifica]MBN1008336.1 OadG family protein [Amphritea pacifica]SEQ94863.1 oxaloacetate decarboxylase, gamma subunit [Amphritea atlantica]
MDNLMSEGLSLMVFGMGFVFVFLTLLVFATGIMSKLIAKVAPEAPVPAKSAPVVAVAAPAGDDELVAVMTAAVHQFRKD